MEKAKRSPGRACRSPDFAAVVGAKRRDPIFETLRDSPGMTRVPIKRYANPRALVRELKQHTLLGHSRTLVVFCSDSADDSLEERIRNIKRCRPRAARIIVYDAPIEVSGTTALNCIAAGAFDYLVRNSLDGDTLKRRFGMAMQDHPNSHRPYPPFMGLDHLTEVTIFVAMPFAAPSVGEYDFGIKPALDRRRIPHLKSDDEQLTDDLLTGLKKQIDTHTILMANLSSSNTNVYFEVGYAMVAGKKLILLRQKGSPEVASDIRSIVRVEYLNCADLALRVYFGFQRARRRTTKKTRSIP